MNTKNLETPIFQNTGYHLEQKTPYTLEITDTTIKLYVDMEIKKILKDGIIRESNSPYNSLIWVVSKELDASGTSTSCHRL